MTIYKTTVKTSVGIEYVWYWSKEPTKSDMLAYAAKRYSVDDPTICTLEQYEKLRYKIEGEYKGYRIEELEVIDGLGTNQG